MAHRILIIITISLIASIAQANSCCGQSPASFTILSLQQKLSLSLSHTLIRSAGRVYSDPKQFFIWENKRRQIQSTTLNAAGTFGQRHQLFINTSFMSSSYEDAVEKANAHHLSDTLLGYSYELLPEYSFSYWKPIIYITALLSLPTGHSIYDHSQISEGTEVTGHNQWGMGVGITAKKVYFPYTLTLQARSIRLLPEEFPLTEVLGFYDHSMAFLVNYASTFWSLAFNAGITWSYLSERRLQPSNISSNSTQVNTILIGLQKPLDEHWSAGINYSDQTLLGPARNTILNRNYSFNINYNYF